MIFGKNDLTVSLVLVVLTMTCLQISSMQDYKLDLEMGERKYAQPLLTEQDQKAQYDVRQWINAASRLQKTGIKIGKQDSVGWCDAFYFVVSQEDKQVRFYNAATNAVAHTQYSSSGFTAHTTSKDCLHVAFGDKQGSISILDISTGQTIYFDANLIDAYCYCYELAFSDDGQKLFVIMPNRCHSSNFMTIGPSYEWTEYNIKVFDSLTGVLKNALFGKRQLPQDVYQPECLQIKNVKRLSFKGREGTLVTRALPCNLWVKVCDDHVKFVGITQKNDPVIIVQGELCILQYDEAACHALDGLSKAEQELLDVIERQMKQNLGHVLLSDNQYQLYGNLPEIVRKNLEQQCTIATSLSTKEKMRWMIAHHPRTQCLCIAGFFTGLAGFCVAIFAITGQIVK